MNHLASRINNEDIQANEISFEGSVFLGTSNVNAFAPRLEWRAKVLIEGNREAIENRNILDLGCHDGRFAWACLKCGAKSVTGVDVRSEHIALARGNLSTMGYGAERATFIAADLVDYLKGVQIGTYDTVLLLGIWSHLIEHIEVARELKRIGARHVILDTWVARPKQNFVERLRNFAVNRHVARTQMTGEMPSARYAPGHLRAALAGKGLYRTGTLVLLYEDARAPGATHAQEGLMAWADTSGVEMVFSHFGFMPRAIDWRSQGVTVWHSLEDYRRRDRASWLMTSSS